MYSEAKVAQMAAYLLMRRNGKMSHLKLMKLLYLADREAIRRYGISISEDHAVSMDHGPVLSMTLDYMNGCARSEQGGWESWISDKENHEVSLVQDVDVDALDELSQADIEVLESVWQQFGKMGRWEIRDWTHKNCAEWQDPKKSMLPIKRESIYRAVNHTDEATREYLADIDRASGVDAIFANL